MSKTWQEAARQWAEHIESINPEQKQNVRMDYLSTLRDSAATQLFDENVQPTSVLWTEMARQAVNELRLLGRWSSEEMTVLLASKQHDYGHGNIAKFGLRGVLVRLSDKVERLANLRNTGRDPLNESYEGTLWDIVGYGIIALMVNEGSFMLELGQ